MKPHLEPRIHAIALLLISMALAGSRSVHAQEVEQFTLTPQRTVILSQAGGLANYSAVDLAVEWHIPVFDSGELQVLGIDLEVRAASAAGAYTDYDAAFLAVAATSFEDSDPLFAVPEPGTTEGIFSLRGGSVGRLVTFNRTLDPFDFTAPTPASRPLRIYAGAGAGSASGPASSFALATQRVRVTLEYICLVAACSFESYTGPELPILEDLEEWDEGTEIPEEDLAEIPEDFYQIIGPVEVPGLGAAGLGVLVTFVALTATRRLRVADPKVGTMRSA